MIRHLLTGVTLIVLGVFPARAGGSIEIVLLDRSSVHVDSAAVEQGMLACRLGDGKKLMLSLGLIDWEFTKRTAPKIYAMACPEAEKKLVEERLAKTHNAPDKPIVITNEDLETLPPHEQPEWVKPTSPLSDMEVAARPDRSKSSRRGSGPVIQTIGSGGANIDIESHLERKKYVLFDFYANWCGPCRTLTPRLESLVNRFPERIALKKIDIVKWGTPVTRQYRINSVPHVKLYNPRGRKIQEGNGFKVIEYLENLSRREGW